MRRLFARLLTHVVRGFHAVINRLVGRRARPTGTGVAHRARLFLAPMESRDHTGSLAGGLALAALGYQFSDPLQGMALAVGDLAMLSVGPGGGPRGTVGDPPEPLTHWLPGDRRPGPFAPGTGGEDATGGIPDVGGERVGVTARASDEYLFLPAPGAPVFELVFPDPVPAPSGFGPDAPPATGPVPGESPITPADPALLPAPDPLPAGTTHGGSYGASAANGATGGSGAPGGAGSQALASSGGAMTALTGDEGHPGDTGEAPPVSGPPGDTGSLPSDAWANPGVVPLVLVVAPDPTASPVGASTGLFRIARVGPIDGDLTVHFRLAGSAVSDRTPDAVDDDSWDYALTAPDGSDLELVYDPENEVVDGTVTIPAGQRTVGLLVTPPDAAAREDDGDGDGEPDPVLGGPPVTVLLNLVRDPEGPTYSIDGALYSAAVAIGTGSTGDIAASTGAGDGNGARGPVITVRAADPNAAEYRDEADGESVSTAAFLVARAGDTTEALTVYYRVMARSTATPDGKSGADHDLPAAYGTVTIEAGRSTASLVVHPVQDAGLEGPETVWVEIVPPPGRLEGRVWDDLDGDGVREPGEAGVEGITVTVDPDAGAGARSGVTDAEGRYWIDGIGTGSHVLRFSLPNGSAYVFTQRDAGDDDGRDSDPDRATGRVAFVMPAGTGLSGVDAGVYGATKVFGTAWTDADGDGRREPGEASTQLTAKLYTAGGTFVDSKPTVNGAYAFTNPAPGNYYVRFEAAAGFMFTAPNAGDDPDDDADPTDDSDALEDGATAVFALRSGDARRVDAGVLAGIGDRVWEDLDADGIQDADDPGTPGNEGEPGLAGVTVTLTVAGGGTQTTVTSAEGYYHFALVPVGAYTVTVTKPGAGYTFSPRGAGEDPGTDSDADAAGVVAVGANDPGARADLDAGLYRATSVAGVAWVDRDGDGVRAVDDPGTPGDESEPVLAGVTVTLLGADGKQVGAPVTTTATGAYSFTGLTPGTYSLAVVGPAGYRFTNRRAGADPARDSDVDDAGATGSFALASGAPRTHEDTGLYRPVTVTSYVWGTTGTGSRNRARAGGTGSRSPCSGGTAVRNSGHRSTGRPPAGAGTCSSPIGPRGGTSSRSRRSTGSCSPRRGPGATGPRTATRARRA